MSDAPTIDRLLETIRSAARQSGLNKCAIAGAARLHPNTLRRLYDPSWSPTVETIRSLEKALQPLNKQETTEHIGIIKL